jgi:hypothetical protein
MWVETHNKALVRTRTTLRSVCAAQLGRGQEKTVNITKPNRKKHSYLQHLKGSPETVFPLLCPVLEAEWVPEWFPERVISQSGVCERECIFITPPEMQSEPENAIWIVTKHDPASFSLEMYKVAPRHTVSKLEITLSAIAGGHTTANVSYELTAIGAEGVQFMEEFTEEWYANFMREWESQLNHYLETGRKIA